ncbi:MAG TPA: hypothetical protein VMV81_06230 [Phycisphaerae bacterium]|nr:hypothetical protein [Phycisphaerae bacterium]
MKTLITGFVLAVAVTAQAAPLNTGQTLFPAPPEPDPTGGVVVVGGVALPFASVNFTGTLTSTVIAGDPTNPFGPAALTFVYRLTNDQTSINSIERLTVNGWTGWLSDASYQIPAAGIIPALADRLSADTIGFSFISPPLGGGIVLPGQASALLVIQSNATAWTSTLASVQDGTNAQVPTYSPAPEPAAAALAVIGLLSLARRRR